MIADEDPLDPELAALARPRRLGRGLRLLDLHRPHTLDPATRGRAAALVRCLSARGPEADRFGGLDGVLVVLGRGRADVRGCVVYTMLRVHRRPVMWVHTAAVRSGHDGPGLLRRALGHGLAREWSRHRCPRRMFVAGLAHPGESLDLRSIVPGATAGTAETQLVGEALRQWLLVDPPRYGLDPQDQLGDTPPTVLRAGVPAALRARLAGPLRGRDTLGP